VSDLQKIKILHCWSPG